jgi:predicted amidohydrolase
LDYLAVSSSLISHLSRLFFFGLPLSAGLAVSSGWPLGIAAAVVMPPLALRAESPWKSYQSAVLYYGAALWPLIPGANNFFGPNVSILAALLLWSVSAAALASPWLLVWSSDEKQALWRAPLGVVLTIVPPLGVIGWASPVLAAGILFPATGWCGFFACVALTGALAVWPRRAAVAAIAVAGFTSLVPPTGPRPPAGWVAVDTRFGSISHDTPSPLAEYRAAQEIQREALSCDATVVIFPETVVPYWTASTDVFWEQTLAALRASGKTIVVGARIPEPAEEVSALPDFSTSLAVLRAERAGANSIRISGPTEELVWQPRYFNAMVIRGSQAAVVRQRVPVPIAMWNPFRQDTALMNLSGAGLVQVGKERVGVIICYEQLIVWPVLMTMIQHPTVLIAPANDYWAMSTTIPTFQRTATRSWARLFGIPYLIVVNT